MFSDLSDDLLQECLQKVAALNKTVRDLETRNRRDFNRDMQIFVAMLKDLVVQVDLALGHLHLGRIEDASASLVTLHKLLNHMIATAPPPMPEVH